MCGRFPQSKSLNRYLKRLGFAERNDLMQKLAATWNLSPSRMAWTIRLADDQYEPAPLKWGFTDGSFTMAPINARVETAASKPMFRESWQKRRCLIPADGWYEWKAEAGGKQPYYFTRTDDEPTFFAGLWTGESFCMFTTDADGKLSSVHHRKPLSLDAENAKEWLRSPLETETLKQMAVRADAIKFFPVSKAVSNWRNDGPQLIEEAKVQEQPREVRQAELL